MSQLKDFYNDGFGWICRQCERELSLDKDPKSKSRLMTEGRGRKQNAGAFQPRDGEMA
jgi:hypothetical protein